MTARTHTPRPQKAEPRPVAKPQGRHEREAERAADVVARGGSVAGWSFSAVPASAGAPVQRQEAPKEKTEDEKQKEALKKAGEAALATKEGQALKEKVLADPLVKTVTDAVTSTPGLIAGGAALAGGVVALGAAGKELPIQPPEIPGEKISPKLAGISAKVTWEGPVFAPKSFGLTITVKEQGPKKSGKPAPDPIAADIARLRAQEEMFRKGRTYAPGSKEAEEERVLDEAVQKFVLSRSALPGFTIPLTPPKPANKEEESAPAQPAPATPSAATPAYAHVDGALATGGRPLDRQTRHTMEARFGHDFSAVRIHDDARAAATAASIDAAAFTVGQDIAFGAGRYSPATAQGRELLAHELAHTIQQSSATSKSPAVPPDSALERRAAAAGRAVARGGAVVMPLGDSGLAVARAPVRPAYLDAYDDNMLADAARIMRVKLRRRPNYPDRDKDVKYLEELTAEIGRREAGAEAVALVARSDADEAADEARERQEAAGGPARAPAAAPRSKFDPGGFDYEAFLKEHVTPERERIERELAPPEDPRPFAVRLREARAKAPPTMSKSDFPESVWRTGRERGLFALREEGAVRAIVDAPRREAAARQTKRDKMRVAQEQQDRFRAFRSQLNLTFIQGALMGGPKAPPLVNFGYAAYSGAETGRAVGHAINTGDPVDIGNAALPIVAGLGFKHLARGEPTAPQVERPAGRVLPEETTPAQVRALYRAEPHSVKKSLSDSFHQQVWEWHGGKGPAPLAFRTGRVMHVNEAQWSRVGNLAEINAPEVLIGPAQRPSDPAATARMQPAADPATAGTLPDPRAATLPAADPATARTQPDPRAATAVDPRSPTVVDPRAQTVPAAGQGTQPSAPPAPARPVTPRPPAMRPATPLTPEDAVAAYRANPGSVHRSVSHEWHEQVWRMDRGQGDVPLAFRSGNRILVDVERLPVHLLAQIGLAMRLP